MTFLIAILLLILAAVLDGASTLKAVAKGWSETNPIFSAKPSWSELVFKGGGIIVAEVAVLFLLHLCKQSATAQFLSVAVPVFQAGAHTNASVRNLGLR